MQHVALLSILYVSFKRVPYVVLLSFAGSNAALPILALLFYPLDQGLQQHNSLI
jgi:hypothetical protein